MALMSEFLIQVKNKIIKTKIDYQSSNFNTLLFSTVKLISHDRREREYELLLMEHKNHRILGRLPEQDNQKFFQKFTEEHIQNEKINAIVESSQLSIDVIDVEYQFDRTKMTVFYNCQIKDGQSNVGNDLTALEILSLSSEIVQNSQTRVLMTEVHADDVNFLNAIDLSVVKSDINKHVIMNEQTNEQSNKTIN